MFLKLFGAAFVIAGCSALGIGYGRKLNLHLEELRFLRELYRMIRGEIQYTKGAVSGGDAGGVLADQRAVCFTVCTGTPCL